MRLDDRRNRTLLLQKDTINPVNKMEQIKLLSQLMAYIKEKFEDSLTSLRRAAVCVSLTLLALKSACRIFKYGELILKKGKGLQQFLRLSISSI